jgi:hypothetical protein
LANLGYEVWVGNNRGNLYSNTHTTFDMNTDAGRKAYWNFSFFELSKYDVPAMVDFVRG